MQAEISQWLTEAARLLPLGYDFGAGMVSAVNPCGFSMLPVYLTLYLGAGGTDFRKEGWRQRLLRGLWISSLVTAGFAVLFGTVGVFVSFGGSYLHSIIPYLTLVSGVLLLLLGGWMLAGRRLSFPVFQRISAAIGDPRDISSKGFFLFGLAFGAASLGCSLPIFLMVVGGSLTSGNFIGGLWHFICYIAGMGSIILFLTLGIALLKEGMVVGWLQKIIPWIEKISAVLLLLAGGYIIYHLFSAGLL